MEKSKTISYFKAEIIGKDKKIRKGIVASKNKAPISTFKKHITQRGGMVVSTEKVSRATALRIKNKTKKVILTMRKQKDFKYMIFSTGKIRR